MKLKLSIKDRFTGSIIFEYEKENNTIKETVEAAIKSYANLSYANLSYADLSSADLGSADLSSADLSYANLSSADLSYANLSYANLSYANLSSANLSSANLGYADLSYAVNADYAISVTRVCAEGDIVGWKKCRGDIIVKLLIPKDAKRNNSFGRKCRAEFADVIEIFGAEKAISKEDSNFIYEVGKRVTPTKPFDEDFTKECSTGIHFFITRLEAENY
jgi:hypothetical protein